MAQDLCTHEDVERLLGLALGSGMDSERLMLLFSSEDGDGGYSFIADCSREFEGLIGREVDENTVTIEVSGDGTNFLLLPRQYTPIITLTSVNYGGGGSDVTVEIDDADAGVLRLGRTSLEGVRDRLGLPRFSLGVNNIVITLTHGWASIPQDVRGTVARMVACELLLLDQDETDGGVSSKRLGDRSIAYGGGGQHHNRVRAHERAINRVLRRYGAEVEV